MKPILPALLAALCVVCSASAIWSFWGNRELEQRILAAARGIPAAGDGRVAAPGIDSLRNLETLRETLVNLTKWQDGPPLRLSFGLYKGNDIRDDVRKIYYAKFRQLLLAPVQEEMLGDLQRLPAGPNGDYRVPYDTLKAYLLTTIEWKRTAEAGLQPFLASQLDARWAADKESETGKERFALAKTQFDFYASDLHNGNPLPTVADEGAVRTSRLYLSQFPAAQYGSEAWVLGADRGH